jgi:hypothetical protein
MNSLSDPITFSARVSNLNGEPGEEMTLTLKIPPQEAANAARLLVMGEIVFKATLVPDDVVKKKAVTL